MLCEILHIGAKLCSAPWKHEPDALSVVSILNYFKITKQQ